MTDQYTWNRGRSTSDEIADADDPRYETPLGAQQKADKALVDAKVYTDAEIEALPEIVGGVGITVTDGDNTKIITATGVALPAPHASTHITGGLDVIPSAVASGNSGLMTGIDKAKLDGIANNANNYTHPNHTGDVTSLGDGVTAIAPGVIVDADVNAAAAIAWTKLSKTGSSLADLATRSAGDLSSGTLLAARLPALTGDITSTVGSTTTAIAAGVIVNADVNATAAIDATKIGTGVVSNTEFGYLDGVTSAIQTQINTKWSDTTTSSRSYTDAAITSNQTLTAVTFTKLAFATELKDNLGEYDPALFRFTALKSGCYTIASGISTISTTPAGTTLVLSIHKNGVRKRDIGSYMKSAAIGEIQTQGCGVLELAAGDYIEMFAYTNVSSITVSGDAGGGINHFTVIKVS